VLLVIFLALTWLPLIWGISLTDLPSWAGMVAALPL
jgi:hypothetical protein